MINNRQQSGRRRRGRNPQGNTGSRNEGGSRIDNRARGNAPQMLEKYKNLARDSQMQGDRVMTEYYLQFADHYFRIVAESRARFEEQRRQRDDWQEGDAPENEAATEDESDVFGEDMQERPREVRTDRSNRERNGNRREYRNGNTARPYEGENDRDNDRDDESREPAQTVSVDILPPALGVTADPVPDLDEAPAPRRRGRPRRTVEAEADIES